MSTAISETPSALEMCHFIDSCKDKHLTLGDIRTLQKGDVLDVVLWDGNWEEYWAWQNAPHEKLFDAEEFFKHNRATFTFKGDMKWDVELDCGIFEHPVHLYTGHLQTYCEWMPIDEKDGKIHITSEYLPKGETEIPAHWKPKHVHWTEFDNSTRAGWRGPAMLWKHLKDLPQVYHFEGSLLLE